MLTIDGVSPLSGVMDLSIDSWALVKMDRRSINDTNGT